MRFTLTLVFILLFLQGCGEEEKPREAVCIVYLGGSGAGAFDCWNSKTESDCISSSAGNDFRWDRYSTCTDAANKWNLEIVFR